MAIAIGLYLLTSAGSLDLHFGSGMITTCIRVLGSLLERIHPERNIDIMVSRRSDANLQTSDGIPALPTAFLLFSPLTIYSSSCTLITSLWPGMGPNAFMTRSRLSVEPTEFAIALKRSFHRFAILLSPEVSPTVSGRDSFLELSALISFQKSLHSPLQSFESIDLERS